MANKWKAESIQAVVFSAPAVAGVQDAFMIWTKIFDATPDGFQKQPNQTSVANGQVNGMAFQMQSIPGRIDLFLQPMNDASGLPSIKDFDAAANALVSAAKKIAEIVPPNRVALVTQFYIECLSQTDAVKKFNETLSFANVPLVSTDLSFTLNIRKKVSGIGVDINRLVRWFTGQRQVIQVQFGPATVQQNVVIVDQPALLLNLDVNTVVDGSSELKPAKADKAFDTLLSESISIRDKGYGFSGNT